MGQIFETVKSRGGKVSSDKRSRTLNYMVALAPGEDEDDLEELVEATIPDTFADRALQEYRYNPLENGAFEVEVEYANTEQKEPEKQDGESSFTFTTSGENTRIYYSRGTRNSYGKNGAAAPDFRNGINVTKESVEGVDIGIPKFDFTVTKIFPASAITGDYIATLKRLTHRVNISPITLTVDGISITFDTGELKFNGARGSRKNQNQWEISCEFTAINNEVDLKVGIDSATGLGTIGVADGEGGFVIPLKFGHDYLWVNYETRQDAITHTIVQTPKSAYLEQVYLFSDLTQLNL